MRDSVHLDENSKNRKVDQDLTAVTHTDCRYGQRVSSSIIHPVSASIINNGLSGLWIVNIVGRGLCVLSMSRARRKGLCSGIDRVRLSVDHRMTGN